MPPRKKQSLSLIRNVTLCYIRLSYTRDENDKDSPVRQRSNIQLECDRRGWIPEWYEDAEGHKSGQSEKNRPGWLALKARLGDHDVVAIVANDLARLHRKGWRVGDLIDFAEEHDVQLVMAAPGRNIDLSGPMGRMSVMIAAHGGCPMAGIWQADPTNHRMTGHCGGAIMTALSEFSGCTKRTNMALR